MFGGMSDISYICTVTTEIETERMVMGVCNSAAPKMRSRGPFKEYEFI